MDEVRLYLFGTPRIDYQNQTIKIARRKALALAAYLALSQQPQSRDVVAALLWPEMDDDRARASLRSTLSALTIPIPISWLQTDRATLALKPDAVWVDVNTFAALLNESRTHAHGVDTVCDDCAKLYLEAIKLYHADFLSGFHLAENVRFDDWQLSQQEWLRREFANVLHRLSIYYAERRQFDPATHYARQWLSLDPLHEPAHRQLMRLYAAAGQRSEAIRQYKQCVDVLDAELATPPESETTQLYEAILSDQLPLETSPLVDNAAVTSIMPPLPSLVVGREETSQEIKRRLGIGSQEIHPTIVIQGWPGVGKSTMVALIAHDREIAQQFPDGVLWVSLGENPDVLGEITTWADALKLTEFGRVRKIEEISAQLTATLRDKRILLIVDDVWKPEHAAPFRVGGRSCALIMTTRLNDVANALAPTAHDIYRLPVLAEAAGLQLLAKLTPETVSQYPNETRELIRDLEGLPLAIHVAGRLLHREIRLGWSVSDLLVELHEGANLLMAQPPSDMLGVGRDISPTVATLLRRSTDALDADMRDRFALLGLFVPKPATFDLEAMAALWDVPDPKPYARRLVDHGLLEPVSGGRFQMHALLVLHARSLLKTESGGLA